MLLCGRYEGIDQRFIDAHVTVQISLGDFVLSGGEIAALALLDAVARLQPGVLNDEGSHQFDSFNPALDGLLDCPHYTRPEHWAGQPCRRRCCRATMRRSSAGGATSAWLIDGPPPARPDRAARAAGRLSSRLTRRFFAKSRNKSFIIKGFSILWPAVL
jgi:tRNA (guanine37-N1)-methyltransferase